MPIPIIGVRLSSWANLEIRYENTKKSNRTLIGLLELINTDFIRRYRKKMIPIALQATKM